MKVIVVSTGPLDDVLEAALAARGHQPLVCRDVGAALATFSRERPFLIVTEARPDEPKPLRRLKAAVMGNGAALLAISESNDPACVAQLLRQGADDCAVRPLDQRDLETRLLVLEGRQDGRRSIWLAGKRANRDRPEGRGRLIRERTGETVPWFGLDEHTLFERIPVGLYRSTPSGDILHVNSTLVTILAAPNRETLMAGNAVDFYIDPEDRERWKERMAREGVVMDFEVRLRRYDNQVIWALLSTQGFKSPQGDILYYEGTIEDVTDRHRAEEALRESEERFRSLFQNSSDMIAILDRKGTVLYESPSHERYLGYPTEERIGKQSTDLVHADDRAEVGRLLQELLANPDGSVSGEFRLRHADGSWRRICSTGTNLLHNPAVGGIVVNSHDITQRHDAEEALRESEERCRRLATAAFEGILIHDQGVIVDANKTVVQMFGYSLEELTGMRKTQLVTPESQQKVADKMASGSQKAYEAVGLRKDGSTFPVEIVGRPIPYRGNSMRVAAVRDITERLRAERELRESEEKHSNLFHHSNDGILLHDLEGVLLDANQRACEQFACSREALLQNRIQTLAAPRNSQVCRNAISDLLESGFVGYEVDFQRKDGVVFAAEVSASLFEIGGRQVVQQIVRDVTERKDAERAQSRFTAILEATTHMVAMADREGRALYINRAGRQMLGIPQSADVFEIHMSDLLSPESAKTLRREGFPTADRKGVWEAETVLRGAQGRQIPASQVLLGHRSPNGQIEYYSTIARDITEQKRSERAIRDSEQRYRGLFEGVPMGLFRIARDGRMLDANLNLVRMLGYPDRESLLSISTTDLYVDPQARRQWQQNMEQMGHVKDFECQVRRGDGGVIWVRSSTNAVRDDQGAILHYEGAVEDITDRKATEEALRRKEELFLSLVQNAPDMIAILDGEGRILYESPAFERVMGRAPAERIGRSAFDYVHPDDLSNVLEVFHELLKGPGKTITAEHRARHADGTWRVLEATGTNLLHNPAVQGIVVNSRDVTDRKRALDQLLHGALFDPLTGLPNRALLIDRLERAVAAAQSRPNRKFAVLFLDLDQFKMINDSLGHTIGDRLLVQIGLALKTVLRPVDTIARLGGDEFVMLLDDVSEEEHAIRVAERVHEILKTPFHIGGHEIFTTTSIGVALSRPNLSEPDELLRDADTAMYRAKAQGRACHMVFDPAMHETALKWLKLETDLRRAVENQEFELLYQPILSLSKGDLIGFEALLRWRHPARGLLSPAEFLSVAEETGLIIPVGRFVIGQVCSQFQTWANNGFQDPLIVSINLSNRQFFHSDLLDDLARIIRRTGVDPERLALEITEGILVHDAESAARRFQHLKEMKVQLFLDDFGTGYSSLSYLHRFPIDTLKIDRSFIAQLQSNAENREIVNAILNLGSSLGVHVIAEGIETAEQAAELRRLGCKLGQGYLFSRPVEVQQVPQILRRRSTA